MDYEHYDYNISTRIRGDLGVNEWIPSLSLSLPLSRSLPLSLSLSLSLSLKKKLSLRFIGPSTSYVWSQSLYACDKFEPQVQLFV